MDREDLGQAVTMPETTIMTELAYIRATNLAKVRATKQVFRDYHAENDAQEREFAEVFKLLDKIEQRLARQVQTSEAA